MTSRKLRGLRFIATLVRGLQRRPAPARHVETRLGLGKCAANRITRVLLDLGVLRIAGWEQSTKQGPPTRVYGVGPEPSVPPPPRRDGSPSRVTFQKLKHPAPELSSFAVLWRALEEPKSAAELVEETGLMVGTIYVFVRHAKAIGLIGVASWARHANMPVAEYQRGVRDVPRPARQDPHVKARRDWIARKERARQARMTAALCSAPLDRGLAA